MTTSQARQRRSGLQYYVLESREIRRLNQEKQEQQKQRLILQLERERVWREKLAGRFI